MVNEKEIKIAIVTPLRNEAANIPQLFSSIEAQSMPIYYWIIVENDSHDGSIEMLQKLSIELKNVKNFKIINQINEKSNYELGVKYAKVVNEGFIYLKENNLIEKLDFLGVLDADCFPEKTYYEALTTGMEKEPGLGISSGLIFDENGHPDLANRNWVRGGCRLWKRECFLDSGYTIAPSADTISACKAMINGWTVKPISTLKVISRQVGDNVNYGYYGYSCYYRGHTSFYAILMTLKLLTRFQFNKALHFAKAYFWSQLILKPRIDDLRVRNYYRWHLLRKLKMSFNNE